MKKAITTAIVSITIGVLLAYYFGYDLGLKRKVEQYSLQAISSFQECVKAGYPVIESSPAQCRTPDDRTFTETISGEIISPPAQLGKIINFEQCASAGGQIMQSNPRQCKSSDGKIFTEIAI